MDAQTATSPRPAEKSYSDLVGRVVTIKVKKSTGIWHGEDLDRTMDESSYLGELLRASETELEICDYKTGQTVKIRYGVEQDPNAPDNFSGNFASVDVEVSPASCQDYATAAPGRFRVLNWDKATKDYTLVRGDSLFDFISLDRAMAVAESQGGIMSQGFVTDDTGKIVHSGQTSSDLDL